MNNARRPIRFHRLAAGHRVVIRAGFDIAIAFAAGATRREGRNKHEARHLSWRTAILSPSPRAWPFNVGRSRYADRLRPNLFSNASDSASASVADQSAADALGRHVIEDDNAGSASLGYSLAVLRRTTVSLGARLACARAGGLCGRKTTPG